MICALSEGDHFKATKFHWFEWKDTIECSLPSVHLGPCDSSAGAASISQSRQKDLSVLIGIL